MFELLNDLVEQNKKCIKNGHVATYIPALAKINPNQLGIAIIDLQNNNKEYFAGEYDTRFAIESISKVPTLILAALDNGLDTVFENIDTEPTGFAFNSILNMEINHRNKPTNPFVNAGAITTTSLVKGATKEERFNRILEFFKKITNDPDIRLNEEIYLSEKKTGDINRSLAYYLKGNNMIKGEISEVLDSYFKQCSLEVNALSLARLGAVLANNGVLPWNDEKLVSKEISTIVKSLMVTCGLYDESGTFGVHIGIPAKSGVGGGILAVVPKRYGIGIFSPALDKKGNSVAGMHLLQDLSQKFDLNIFE